MAIIYMCGECNVEFYRYCPICKRDREGYTAEERAKKRPVYQVHYENGVVYRNIKKRRSTKHTKPRPFADAVVPGSVVVRTLE